MILVLVRFYLSDVLVRIHHNNVRAAWVDVRLITVAHNDIHEMSIVALVQNHSYDLVSKARLGRVLVSLYTTDTCWSNVLGEAGFKDCRGSKQVNINFELTWFTFVETRNLGNNHGLVYFQNLIFCYTLFHFFVGRNWNQKFPLKRRFVLAQPSDNGIKLRFVLCDSLDISCEGLVDHFNLVQVA